MPAPPATPAWELEGPYGSERWVGEPGRYQGVFLEDEQLSLDPRDGELQFLRARGSNCVHHGPWPFAFGFCPHCGKALPDPPPEKLRETWSSPANGATGLPPPGCRGVPDAGQRGELPLPGPSNLDFAVAGTPSRLLALDRTTGRLHVWRDALGGSFEGERWMELAPLGNGFNLPPWSWSVAASETGLVLAADHGPLWVSLRPRGVRVVRAEPGLGISRSLGGAGRAADLMLVPVATADTALAVAVWLPQEARWELAHVANTGLAIEQQFFAAPSVNASDMFWVGERGQLFARVENGHVRCEYRPWRGDWKPMQAVRPVLLPSGQFYQLGRCDGRQYFEALTTPGGTPEGQEFERYVISCGLASFGGMVRYREPWKEKKAEYRDVTERPAFLAPLLAFPGDRFLLASCFPRPALLPFIETGPGAEPNVECRIVFAHGSVSLTDLRATLRARHIWELTAFVYARTVFVYEAQNHRCFFWPLNDDKG